MANEFGMREKKSFIKYIQLWVILIIITIGGSMIAIDIVRAYRDFNSRADLMREDYTARQKQIVKDEVKRVVNRIRNEKAKSENLTKTKIKSRGYEAYAIAQHIYRQNKDTKSDPEIQQMIIDAIKPIRFEKGSGYYYIYQLDGKAVLFPSNPNQEGQSLLSIRDTHGQYLAKDMIDITRKSGEGFYEYHWKKPDASGSDFKKIAFIKRFEPYDWYIGTGLYVEDIEEQINQELLITISHMRYGKEGYIFINRFNGDALVSNGKVVPGNKKLWEVFDKDPEKTKDLFRKEYEAAQVLEGDYIYYSLIKLSNQKKESPKVSFIYGIPELQWLVGAGVYLDDVETDIALMHAELDNRIKAKLLYFTLLAMCVIAFSLFLFSRLNLRLKRDFNLFISFFNQAALSNEPINRDLIQFDELDKVAENANKMLLDRKQAEEAFRQSEAKFRALVESSSDLIWEVDSAGVYTYVSPQVEQMLGYKPEELIGKNPFELMPPGEAKRIEALFKEVVKNETSFIALENICLHKNGRHIVLETNGVPVFDEERNLIGYRGVDRDITERKQTEETLQKMEKLESLGTLAGGIAHDFNNILMGLFGNISIAKSSLSQDLPGFKSLEEAEKSMNRAIRLTKQLLTFAKGGAPVTESIRLEGLVEEVVRFDLSGSNVKPLFERADDLWHAKVDKGQIQQVFSNLTINARQAMPDGGHLHIKLENVKITGDLIPGLNPGKYIKVKVIDEGVGIDRSHLGRIFDPYFTTKQAGNGLGLATVYSVITKHGGFIGVDSHLGKGTTITLYLPASDSTPLPVPGKPETKVMPAEQSARVLVMDDEEMIRNVVTAMLERSGYSVETADGGRQAIELYKGAIETGNPFDIVIMDLTIPGGMGGKDAVRDILSIDPEARVIVSSGYTNDPVLANYMAYGFRGIVEKPYTSQKILDEIDRIL